MNDNKIRRLCLLALVGLLMSIAVSAGASQREVELGIEVADLNKLTENYLAERPQTQVAYWKTLMPVGTVGSEGSRDALAGLPSEWTKHQLRDSRLTECLSKLISPVLHLYGKSYQIVVLEFNKPVIIIDSDALLIFSTELLKRLRSEEELLGLVAHEVAHSLFLEKSEALKPLLNDKTRRGLAIKYLALIELSCDAVAVRTLLALRRDPLAFLRLIVNIEGAYLPSRDASPFYPSASLRLKQAATVSTSVGDSAPCLPFKAAALSLLK